MSKGSKRRPTLVPDKVVRTNWIKVFGETTPQTYTLWDMARSIRPCKPAKRDVEHGRKLGKYLRGEGPAPE